jgi:hypothetical protein
MAQHDYDIANQTFPSFRSDLNSVLEAINTSNSGTSRPSSAVAGTIWLDVTNATSPTLKFFDGNDDISLATIDYSANTVNWIDSTVVFDIVNDTTPQLGGNLDVNGNSLVSTSNGNITFTPDGTGKVVISGLSFPTSDGSADQVLTTDGSGNLSFSDISGGTSWQSSIKTSAFTAVAGEGYWINTTSSAVTVTLPSSASVGDTIEIVDYARTWGTNNVTLNRNGLNYQGGTENPVYDVDGQSVKIVYSGATQGWIPTSDDDVTNEAALPSYSVDFLVIAGGASGGRGSPNSGGGGGAGGYRNSYNSETSGGGGSSESSLTLTQGTTYTITVGAGGSARTSDARGDNGQDSSISGSDITDITSAGGGGGGAQGVNGDGIAGGSGGGACYGSSSSAQTGGAGTANQGFRGGNKENTTLAQGAGGGGAGTQGVDCSTGSNEATNGGNGVASTITGSSVTRSGGGGGSAVSAPDSSGGTGGGGNSSLSGTAGSGTINTGSGGGGTRDGTSGAGGSGVVIIRMATADYSGTTTGSPTVSTDGTDTILTYTGSGSYTG